MTRVAIALVLAAACGKPGDFAAVNDLVPAAWKGKIEFVPTTIDTGSAERLPIFSVAAPKGWTPMKAFPPGSLQPPDASESRRSPTFGDLVTMSLFANCDYRKPRDGRASAAHADEWLFAASYEGPGPTRSVVKDDRQPARRVMIVHDRESGHVYLKVVWWKASASACYWGCRATLARESRDLAPAFERACLTATAVE